MVGTAAQNSTSSGGGAIKCPGAGLFPTISEWLCKRDAVACTCAHAGLHVPCAQSALPVLSSHTIYIPLRAAWVYSTCLLMRSRSRAAAGSWLHLAAFTQASDQDVLGPQGHHHVVKPAHLWYQQLHQHWREPRLPTTPNPLVLVGPSLCDYTPISCGPYALHRPHSPHNPQPAAATPLQVLERFAQRQSSLLRDQAEERVLLQLHWEDMPDAASFPHRRLGARIHVVRTPPVLRSLHFTRTAGSGTASESLIRGLFAHMDVSTAWKLRGCEGLPSHFWASCTDALLWRCLFNLNLSACGLAALPGAVGQLASLHVLRINYNKLTSLPPELGLLSELEVLSVNHNQLTTLPGEA